MTGILASVNSVEEAKLVLAEKVDIIDLKEPALGSLGGLDVEVVKQIVGVVDGQCLTSATIGDLPMQPELIFAAVEAMQDTGVNYVKIGLFPNGNVVQVIDRLSLISKTTALIAVMFADTNPDFNLIDNLAAAGFKGIMLDTQDKSKGSLTGVMAKAEIEVFVNYVKSRQLISGLAGSLSSEDIPLLQSYQPHYLGFRGALCESHQRTGRLSPLAVRRIKQTITDCMT
jgi:(5-formylfuran-3-yl)methyl phosphate synthase